MVTQLFVQQSVQNKSKEKYQSYALLALCEGIPSVTDGFPSQRVSNVENISISWHQELLFGSNNWPSKRQGIQSHKQVSRACISNSVPQNTVACNPGARHELLALRFSYTHSSWKQLDVVNISRASIHKAIKHLNSRSHKAVRLRFKTVLSLWIWQASQHQWCRVASQNSEWCYNFNTSWHSFEILQDTVRCHFNAVDFLQNHHNRHPIAQMWGLGVGCLLWG